MPRAGFECSERGYFAAERNGEDKIMGDFDKGQNTGGQQGQDDGGKPEFDKPQEQQDGGKPDQGQDQGGESVKPDQQN
ncbi:MAG TPA: hypothetical protein VEX35_01870 [Allosphingosinicella sp.]|nr:hypothetical protein [Allosphingosinicella sp.]